MCGCFSGNVPHHSIGNSFPISIIRARSLGCGRGDNATMARRRRGNGGHRLVGTIEPNHREMRTCPGLQAGRRRDVMDRRRDHAVTLVAPRSNRGPRIGRSIDPSETFGLMVKSKSVEGFVSVHSSKPNPADRRRIGHPLLDYLVGEREQRRRHLKAGGLGGRQVDHQLKPGRLHHRQVGGLLTL